MTTARAVPSTRSIVALVCLCGAAPLQAQPPAGAETLRVEVEAEYRVTPIRGGIGLLPRDGDRGYSLIELRGDAVLVDGQPGGSAQQLAAGLGADAALILRLMYLDVETQRSVLGLPALTDAESTAPTPPADPEVVEPVTAAVEADESTPPTRERRLVHRDRVSIGGRVHVAVDERVRGDVVVIGGSLVVDGEVQGDIVVVAGSATFGPEAIARRDVAIVGGRLIRDPGARFLRGVDEVNFDMIDLDFADFGGLPRIRLPRPSSRVFQGLDLVGTLMRFAFFGLLGSVVLLISVGSSERVAGRVAFEPVKAGFVGLLAQLLFAPLLITGILLLVITIIGIPLLVLVPVVLVGALVVMVLGFTGIAQGVGRRFTGGAGQSHRSAFVLFWLGLVILMTPTLFGEALGLMGGPFRFFALILGVVGFVVEYVAWTAGLGAVILNRFGGVPAGAGGAPPPPIPEAPAAASSPAPDLPLSSPASSDDAV